MGGMKFEVVTTCNAEGFAEHGAHMMHTFARMWPDEVGFCGYTEGWEPILERPNSRFLPLLETSPWLRDFRKRHRDDLVKGMPWDALRFAYKVAAWTHAAVTTKADYLIWMDADTLTHSPIDLNDLQGLAPGGSQWISWLDRKHPPYPECGFFILNRGNPFHTRNVAVMVDRYVSDDLYDMEQWHDSWVLWKTVEQLRVHTASLSAPGGWQTTHPFINGPLGKWFDHMKGDRKSLGRSRASDLKTERKEAYWNG